MEESWRIGITQKAPLFLIVRRVVLCVKPGISLKHYYRYGIVCLVRWTLIWKTVRSWQCCSYFAIPTKALEKWLGNLIRQPLSNRLYNDGLQYGSFIVCFTMFTLCNGSRRFDCVLLVFNSIAWWISFIIKGDNLFRINLESTHNGNICRWVSQNFQHVRLFLGFLFAL